MMLHYLAIAAAVTGQSPVTMITLIPAAKHFLTAKGTASLGGSTKETKPMKPRPAKEKLKSLTEPTLNQNPLGYSERGKCNLAKPRTLSPHLPKERLT